MRLVRPRLSDAEWAALRAAQADGMSVREAARRLGLAKTRVGRAYRWLRGDVDEAPLSPATPPVAPQADVVDPDLPAAGESTGWFEVEASSLGSTRLVSVRVHAARVFGRLAMVDEGGRVFCHPHCCDAMLDVDFLRSRESRGHRMSAWPPYGIGEVRPLDDPSSPEPPERSERPAWWWVW